MAGGGGGGEGEPEFQIAPMVDVLLVLLIFFMSITSAQVLKVDKTVTLPISANAMKKDNSRAEAIVNVKWDAARKRATYTMDDRAYPELADLTKALAAAKKTRRNQDHARGQSHLSLRDPRRSRGQCA